MAHLSENAKPLLVKDKKTELSNATFSSESVEFIILPYCDSLDAIADKKKLYTDLTLFLNNAHDNATIGVLCSSVLAADFCSSLPHSVHLKLWISVKLKGSKQPDGYLQNENCALLIITKYAEPLKHIKTRISYTYCPCCNKTTKDYGGKKHLYHEYGTLLSDVWRDIEVDFSEKPTPVIDRLKDLFGIREYRTLNVYDQRNYYRIVQRPRKYKRYELKENAYKAVPSLFNNDCIKQLEKIPDNSIDFCFADPPYNLQKKYENWNDGIDIQQYFEWCDQWLTQLARILKPGRTLAVLNIPQWCVRHFKHLNTILDFQDWIVWEGLSMPVRMIMPSHYSVLCFSKGKPRKLPILNRKQNTNLENHAVTTIKERFCARTSCVKTRRDVGVIDTKLVSNVWYDVHRLKHNSRRVDHPCQLPPIFMLRLISLFTNVDEIVVDPFNGVGTTSLTVQQLNRKYVGIELSEYYHGITVKRHDELKRGIDPFRKINDASPKAKNSPVLRIKKQKYEVSKKVLQLEVKRIFEELGTMPTKEHIQKHSQYPLEYYENYFINWGEVTAAARTTGMTENKRIENMF